MVAQVEIASNIDPADTLDGQFKAAYVASVNALKGYWRPNRGMFVYPDRKPHSKAEVMKNFKLRFDGQTDPASVSQIKVFNRLIGNFIESL